MWRLNPDDFDDVMMDTFNEKTGMSERGPVDVEFIELMEYDVNEWIDEVRSVARANGCTQISGLRSTLHRRMP